MRVSKFGKVITIKCALAPLPDCRAAIRFFVALLAIFGALAPMAQAETRPNIIVIMTDDQDASSIEDMTRVYNQVAAAGTTFTNSFVSLSQCCPSRATFLTGQYAHNHGVTNNGVDNPLTGGYAALDNTNTLAVWLKNSGYYTAMIGKYLNNYGLVDTNPSDGVPANKEIPPGWNYWIGALDPYNYNNYRLNENGVIQYYNGTAASFLTDVEAKKADTFIRSRAGNPQPFFLWLTFTSPHAPTYGSTVAPRHAGIYAKMVPPRIPGYNEEDTSDKPSFFQSLPRLEPFASTEYQTVHNSYRTQRESLMAVDEAVGKQIMKALTDTAQAGNTVVIYTSDNGFFHGEHRITHGKGLPYEPGQRVPLIVKGPGLLGEQAVPEIVANVDLAPTIVDLAQVPPQYVGRIMDGQSLVPLLKGQSIAWRTALLFESPSDADGNEILGEGSFPHPPFTAVRTPQFTYVEYNNGEQELYDMTKDPYQLENQQGNPAYVLDKADLQAKLSRLQTCAGASCWE